MSVLSLFRGMSPTSASSAGSCILLVWVLFFPFKLPWNGDGNTSVRALCAHQAFREQAPAGPARPPAVAQMSSADSELQAAAP